jgi:regulator of protease activity HflC (stomatin/prohibitin superfamily)
MPIFSGFVFGVLIWFLVRYGAGGFYTISPNERAVLTSFGRAQRLGAQTTGDDPALVETLRRDEAERYRYPQVRVIGSGFYWKFPWQTVHMLSIATTTVSIAFDPETPSANENGFVLEAVTKDQLNIRLTGQMRFAVSERNLYAYLFGVKNPVAHIMGYFISILRDRIANFEAPEQAVLAATPATPPAPAAAAGTPSTAPIDFPVQQISINDLRKHLRDLNERMNVECKSAEARYGIVFDAALITGIDPPTEVESALAAINTAHNQVSSEISLAQASADQKIVMSRRAVEIETLNAQAEVEPLLALANELNTLKSQGPGALRAYVRNARLALFRKVGAVVISHEVDSKS